MSNESEFLSVSDIRSDEFSRMQAQAYNNDILRLHKRLDEFVDTLCPACGSDLSSYKFEKYKCKFVECSECETLYMSPRPTPEIMNDYYSNSENYSIWSKYIFPKSESNRRDKICQPNLMKIIDVCDKFGLVDPEILEIGPGFGTFSELAKDSGFFRKVKVIERTPEMVEACRNRGLEVIDGVLENIVEKKIAD